MKKTKRIFSLLIFSFWGLTGLQAQESINTTGGNATGSGGSVSYSVGQIVYQTYTGANGSVAEGVQQPYEISVITGINEAKGINLSVTAYPNPTTDFLTLEVKDFEFSGLHFQLYDMHGRLLQSQKITESRSGINMIDLVPATYFIKVIKNNKEVKTFKIVKY